MDIPTSNLTIGAASVTNGEAYLLPPRPTVPSNASKLPRLMPKPSNECVPMVPIPKDISSKKITKSHHCLSCKKRFVSPGRLLEHQFSHTGELPYSCQLCNGKFKSKSILTRHGLTHSKVSAFVCNECDKKFRRKDHLTNHIRVHNPERRILMCDKEGCSQKFFTPLNFRKHSALHAVADGRLDCIICNTVFSNSTNLLQHLKMHITKTCNVRDKKFSCEHCAHKFVTSKDLRRHQVVHTGSRDFACIYCPIKFGRKDHLVRHVKGTHADFSAKPYDLSQVVVVKTDEKPKLKNSTYLGLKYSPSISEYCAISSRRTSPAKSNFTQKNTEKLSVESFHTSTGTLHFLEVPIETETAIKQEPLSDVEETDTLNLDIVNIKTEIVS